MLGTCCPSLVCAAVINPMSESSSGRKGFIWRTVLHHSLLFKEVRTGTQGKHLEAGNEAEAIERCCLLACLSFFLIHVLHVPAKWHQPCLAGLSYQLLIKEMPYTLAYR